MSLNEDIGKLTNTWPILLDHFISASTLDVYLATALPLIAHSKTPPHAMKDKPAGIQANIINLNCFRLNINASIAGRNQRINTPTNTSAIKA
jgi:hypothetical protein